MAGSTQSLTRFCTMIHKTMRGQAVLSPRTITDCPRTRDGVCMCTCVCMQGWMCVYICIYICIENLRGVYGVGGVEPGRRACTCRGPGFDVPCAVHHRILRLSLLTGSQAVPIGRGERSSVCYSTCTDQVTHTPFHFTDHHSPSQSSFTQSLSNPFTFLTIIHPVIPHLPYHSIHTSGAMVHETHDSVWLLVLVSRLQFDLVLYVFGKAGNKASNFHLLEKCYYP